MGTWCGNLVWELGVGIGVGTGCGNLVWEQSMGSQHGNSCRNLAWELSVGTQHGNMALEWTSNYSMNDTRRGQTQERHK